MKWCRTSHRCQFGCRARLVPAHESRPPASWQAGSVSLEPVPKPGILKVGPSLDIHGGSGCGKQGSFFAWLAWAGPVLGNERTIQTW
jgi:hypothetical protein